MGLLGDSVCLSSRRTGSGEDLGEEGGDDSSRQMDPSSPNRYATSCGSIQTVSSFGRMEGTVVIVPDSWQAWRTMGSSRWFIRMHR